MPKVRSLTPTTQCGGLVTCTIVGETEKLERLEKIFSAIATSGRIRPKAIIAADQVRLGVARLAACCCHDSQRTLPG
jgi:hypothetical protein